MAGERVPARTPVGFTTSPFTTVPSRLLKVIDSVGASFTSVSHASF